MKKWYRNKLLIILSARILLQTKITEVLAKYQNKIFKGADTLLYLLPSKTAQNIGKMLSEIMSFK